MARSRWRQKQATVVYNYPDGSSDVVMDAPHEVVHLEEGFSGATLCGKPIAGRLTTNRPHRISCPGCHRRAKALRLLPSTGKKR